MARPRRRGPRGAVRRRVRGPPPAVRVLAPRRVVHGRGPGAAAFAAGPRGRARLPHLLRPARSPGPRALHPVRAADDRARSTTPRARCWSSWRGSIAGSSPTTRCLPSSATPSWPPRTRTSSPTPAWNTGRCRGWCTRRRCARWPRGGRAALDFRLRFPQGGSTLTQQLVRGYFLRDRSSRENGTALFRTTATRGSSPRPWASPTTNKLLRKMEEMRLALWLEEEMRRRYGSREQAKREIFARVGQLQLPRQRPLRLRRRLRVLLRQAPVELHAAGCGEGGVAGGDHQGAPGLRAGARRPAAPAPPQRDPGPDGAQRLHPREPRQALPGRAGPPVGRPAARSRPTPPPRSSTVFDELKQHGAGRFGVEDLFQGRISVHSTVDERVQTIVNEALENGLALYEKRHPGAKGLIQGSVVVLRNADAAILAEAGGRQVYKDRRTRLLRLQPRHRLAAAAGLGLEAAGLPGRVPPGPEPRHHGARRAHRGADGGRSPGEVDHATTTTSSRARSRCARRWPSPATRWRCGSPARSAWTG